MNSMLTKLPLSYPTTTVDGGRLVSGRRDPLLLPVGARGVSVLEYWWLLNVDKYRYQSAVDIR